MKSSITALCIAVGVLGSSLSFAATTAAPAEPTATTSEPAAVTAPAKKHVKKHAAKKAVKKAAVAS